MKTEVLHWNLLLIVFSYIFFYFFACVGEDDKKLLTFLALLLFIQQMVYISDASKTFAELGLPPGKQQYQDDTYVTVIIWANFWFLLICQCMLYCLLCCLIPMLLCGVGEDNEFREAADQ